MDFTQRKINRIHEYDYSQNGAYFVTICTQDRRKILSDIVGDGFPVPKPYGTIAEEFIHQIPVKYPEVSVDRYVIMPDHIHMLLRINRHFGTGDPSPTSINRDFGTGDPSPTLGNIIGWYKYQVTKEINLRFGQQGEKMFQKSYYDHVIRNQKDYDEIWEYIENNPRKWVIKKTGHE